MEPIHQNRRLRWDHTVHLIGEKVSDPLVHCCEKCAYPILIYGRMIPCKHVFCLNCAKKTDKVCPRCQEGVQRIEQSALGSVFVCTHGGPKHSSHGCKRTYLSQRDLQAHVDHRHSKMPPSSSVHAEKSKVRNTTAPMTPTNVSPGATVQHTSHVTAPTGPVRQPQHAAHLIPQAVQSAPAGHVHPQTMDPSRAGQHHPQKADSPRLGQHHPQSIDPSRLGQPHPQSIDPSRLGQPHQQSFDPSRLGQSHPRPVDPSRLGQLHQQPVDPARLGQHHPQTVDPSRLLQHHLSTSDATRVVQHLPHPGDASRLGGISGPGQIHVTSLPVSMPGQQPQTQTMIIQTHHQIQTGDQLPGLQQQLSSLLHSPVVSADATNVVMSPAVQQQIILQQLPRPMLPGPGQQPQQQQRHPMPGPPLSIVQTSSGAMPLVRQPHPTGSSVLPGQYPPLTNLGAGLGGVPGRLPAPAGQQQVILGQPGAIGEAQPLRAQPSNLITVCIQDERQNQGFRPEFRRDMMIQGQPPLQGSNQQLYRPPGGPGPSQVGPGPSQVGPGPSQVGPGPSQVGPGPSQLIQPPSGYRPQAPPQHPGLPPGHMQQTFTVSGHSPANQPLIESYSTGQPSRAPGQPSMVPPPNPRAQMGVNRPQLMPPRMVSANAPQIGGHGPPGSAPGGPQHFQNPNPHYHSGRTSPGPGPGPIYSQPRSMRGPPPQNQQQQQPQPSLRHPHGQPPQQPPPDRHSPHGPPPSHSQRPSREYNSYY